MKRVLIVDDDPVCVLLAEFMLRDEYEISSVNNGFDAINACNENEFDLVLMDINLGNINMDGITTMRKIKNERKNRKLKIVAITAYSDRRKWFVEQGFCDLILKPLDKPVLNEIISKFSGCDMRVLSN